MFGGVPGLMRRKPAQAAAKMHAKNAANSKTNNVAAMVAELNKKNASSRGFRAECLRLIKKQLQ